MTLASFQTTRSSRRDNKEFDGTVHEQESVSESCISDTQACTKTDDICYRTNHHSNHVKEHPIDKTDLSNQGFPGYLSATEQSIYNQLQQEIQRYNNEWRDTIFCFGYNEKEEFALCRWLRARKFVLCDVLKMIQDATAMRSPHKIQKFYPNPEDALGVEESVFKSQFPQLFYSRPAKNGCPIYISKPGAININALECITTVENMNKYQWYSMIHGASSQYKSRQRSDPSFERFQNVVIVDLDGVSTAMLGNGKVLKLIKHQSIVDSLCFPEVLNRLIVINAPTFFTATWKIIKRFLDPRTQSKIEIYSFRSSWEKRLLELVEADNLPMDYGGRGPSIADAILVSCKDTSVSRRVTELMSIKSESKCFVDLFEQEMMDVIVYTRSVVGADFSVTRGRDHKVDILGTRHVQATQTEEIDPDGNIIVHNAREAVASKIIGPGRFFIHGDSRKSRLSLQNEHYLVVMNISLRLVELKMKTIYTGAF